MRKLERFFLVKTNLKELPHTKPRTKSNTQKKEKECNIPPFNAALNRTRSNEIYRTKPQQGSMRGVCFNIFRAIQKSIYIPKVSAK